MKFGIAFANTGPFQQPDAALEMARAAEEAGFESLWTVEHVIFPDAYESEYPYDRSGKMVMAPETDLPDPLIWLTWVAAVTERIHLATGILILPQRNPVVLAKELATLDKLSGGRMLLGIGVGWLEEEFDAIGVPFGKRGRITDEYMEAMRALWTEEKASFHGEFADFTDCIMRPRPVQERVPIHVGGHSEAAARRAGRLGDGFFPGKGTHEEIGKLFEVTRAAAREAGRDPSAIEMTSGGNGALGPNALDEVKALADLGVTRVMIPAFMFWGDTAAGLARYGEDVIAKAG